MAADATISPQDLIQFDATPDADYAHALESVAPSITAKIAEQNTAGESWSDTLQRILPLIVGTVQQKEILNIQLERAKQGLPPLDNSQFGASVNVGLTPDVKQYLMIGGVAILAILLMSRK